MTMADSDRRFFSDLVEKFKTEIINYMDRKFDDQEKLYNSKLSPVEKTQDRFRKDIDDLYEKNRIVSGTVSHYTTTIDNHLKDHDKTDRKSLPRIAIIVSVLSVITTIILSIIFGG